jgi:hypothetical protein
MGELEDIFVPPPEGFDPGDMDIDFIDPRLLSEEDLRPLPASTNEGGEVGDLDCELKLELTDEERREIEAWNRSSREGPPAS